MKSLWQQYIGVNLDEYLTTVELFKLLNSKGYSAHQNDSYEDLFFKIFLNEIETHLGIERPMFVYDYPKQMCSLSRLSKQDNRYAERAELYVGGLEIANGFGELVDSVEQKKHLEQDRDERIKLSKPTWGVDPGFIAALEAGVPEAGGIALGIDRMVMLCTGASNINDVIFQTINDQLT
jgi:lysyl-tRNA synthetase class 2